MNRQNNFNLAALGIACSLGCGTAKVAKNLFSASPKSSTKSIELISGKIVNIHMVPDELPQLPIKYQTLNSRCNKLLKVALDEIAVFVQESKRIYKKNRIGVVLATSTSGMLEAEIGFAKKLQTNQFPVDYAYAMQEIASPSIFAAQYFDIDGPAYTISTACTSSSKALLSASRLIAAGICDAVICGGVDVISNVTLNGFDSLELLSEHNCKPLSNNRDGIVLGEGAAVFLLTRDNYLAAHNISLLGGMEVSESYHISSPNPDGSSIKEVIEKALAAVALTKEDILYVSLHGTGTKLNDAIESKVIHEIFADSVYCSSSKAIIGHTLGSSGAIAAGFIWLALALATKDKISLPPHIWDGAWDPNLPKLKLVTSGMQRVSLQEKTALMSNSFAFGGSNVCLVFGYNNC